MISVKELRTSFSISDLIVGSDGVSICLCARYHPLVIPSSTAREMTTYVLIFSCDWGRSRRVSFIFDGAYRGIRTHPVSILSRLPLPLGYVGVLFCYL